MAKITSKSAATLGLKMTKKQREDSELAAALVRNAARADLEALVLQHVTSADIIDRFQAAASVAAISLGRHVQVQELVIRANAKVGSFNLMGDELLLNVFSYLTSKEKHRAIYYVCKDWYGMHRDPRLWERLFIGSTKGEVGLKVDGKNLSTVLESLPLQHLVVLTLVFDKDRHDVNSWKRFFKRASELNVRPMKLVVEKFKLPSIYDAIATSGLSATVSSIRIIDGKCRDGCLPRLLEKTSSLLELKFGPQYFGNAVGINDPLLQIPAWLRKSRGGVPLLKHLEICSEGYTSTDSQKLLGQLPALLPELEYLSFGSCTVHHHTMLAQYIPMAIATAPSPNTSTFVPAVHHRLKALKLYRYLKTEGNRDNQDMLEDFFICVGHCFPALEVLHISCSSSNLIPLGPRALSGGRFRGLSMLRIHGVEIHAQDVEELDLSRMKEVDFGRRTSDDAVLSLQMRKPELRNGRTYF